MEDLDFDLIKPGALIEEFNHFKIYKCKYNSNYTCSFKHFKTEKVMIDKLKDCSLNLNRELKRLKYNTNIERFIGTCFDDQNQFYMVSEFIVGKTLSQFIKEDIKDIPFETKAKICFQLALGLEFLHINNFVHRNLMATNVLLDYEDNYCPKVTEICLHEILDTIDEANKIVRTRDDFYWKAPEITDLTFSSGSKKADIFAFGIMMWEILSEKSAQFEVNNLIGKDLAQDFKDIPEDFINIITATLSNAPEQRPSAQELTFSLHPFAGNDDSDLGSDEEGTTELQSTTISEMPEHATQLDDQETILLYKQGLEFLGMKDYVNAAKCFDLPAWNNHAESQYYLGRAHLFGLGRERNLMLATKWLESAANNNHLDAEFLLASLFYFGVRESGRIDKDEAAYLFQKLNKKNHVASRVYLAYCYETGSGIDANPEKAIKLYEKCVEEEDSIALFRLAKMYELGLGTEKNSRMAIELHQRAASLGNPHSKFHLGKILEVGAGMQKDPNAAFQYIKSAANLSHPEAIYHLGRFYQRGFGVEINHLMALELFKKSAELNVAKACHSIGHMYDKGRGVPQDSKLAVFWYLKSANAGDRFSQNNLARCYHLGSGVPKDMEKAIYWYRRSCDQGVVQAYVNLGRCYEQGSGVEKNYGEAFKYYKAAAEQNDANGLYKLGSCYEEGFGTEKDLNVAMEYYKQAGEKGSEKALARMNQLLKPLPPIDQQVRNELVAVNEPHGRNIANLTIDPNPRPSSYQKPLPEPIPLVASPKIIPPPSPKGSMSSLTNGSKKTKSKLKKPEDFLSLDNLYTDEPKSKAKSKNKKESKDKFFDLPQSNPTLPPELPSVSNSTRSRLNRLTAQRFDVNSMSKPRVIPNLAKGSKSNSSLSQN
ncbi:HCP-like protein [Neoconidiobolus thromboides FSU 785]|nr:HCP-like protein [Neoconidiobolus thromboides FSU 785]